jgi:hypothetical protein
MSGDTYQAPGEGFRGEVTRAALQELINYTSCAVRAHCPSCGAELGEATRRELQAHAESCVELRGDVAERL